MRFKVIAKSKNTDDIHNGEEIHFIKNGQHNVISISWCTGGEICNVVIPFKGTCLTLFDDDYDFEFELIKDLEEDSN